MTIRSASIALSPPDPDDLSTSEAFGQGALIEARLFLDLPIHGDWLRVGLHAKAPGGLSRAARPTAHGVQLCLGNHCGDSMSLLKATSEPSGVQQIIPELKNLAATAKPE